jgi:hypothetical protein
MRTVALQTRQKGTLDRSVPPLVATPTTKWAWHIASDHCSGAVVSTRNRVGTHIQARDALRNRHKFILHTDYSTLPLYHIAGCGDPT